MKRKVLLPLLFALSATPAVAAEWGSVFDAPLPAVAQMSADERRALRERWEEASPEERVQLRRAFQDRMRQLPGDPFTSRGLEMGERMSESWRNGGGSQFGTGYESRRYEDDHRSVERDPRDRSRGRR